MVALWAAPSNACSHLTPFPAHRCTAMSFPDMARAIPTSLYTLQVHLARCKPLNTLVAVKLVDLEELTSSLELLIKEAHTMKGLRHPNVLPLHCSFVADSALWLVMPYIGGGNVSQLLRSQVGCSLSADGCRWPQSIEGSCELLCATVCTRSATWSNITLCHAVSQGDGRGHDTDHSQGYPVWATVSAQSRSGPQRPKGICHDSKATLIL